MNNSLYINRILVYPKLGRCDVTFRQGLNVIISEDVLNISEDNFNENKNDLEDNKPQDSVNSTGKTTFVHLIDYALGKSFFITNEFNENEDLFADKYVIAEISIHGVKYTIKRSILDTDIVTIYYDWVSQSIIEDKLKQEVYKTTRLDGYISFLDEQVFQGKNYFKDKSIVTYRSIMNFIIRDQFFGFTNYYSGLRIEQAESSRERLDFLFGLITSKNLLLKDEISKLLFEKKGVNNEFTVLKKYLLQTLDKTPAAIKKEIKENEKIIEKLNIELNKYNKTVMNLESVKDEDKSIKKKLEEKVKVILNDITAIKSRVSSYNVTLCEIENELNKLNYISISMSILNPFKYKKCPIYMREIDTENPSIYKCPLVKEEEENNKNNEIIEARKKLLNYEKNDLERALIYLNEQLEDSTNNYNSLKVEINKVNEKIDGKENDIISKRDSLRDQIKELEFNNKTLEHQLCQYLYLDSLSKSKKDKQADISIKRAELSKSSTNITRINEIYNEVVDFLSHNSREGTLDSKTFEPYILFKNGQVDTGAGMRSIAIIAFDLTMLTFSLEKRFEGVDTPYMNFLIHDSPKRNDIYLVMYKRIFDYIIKLEENYLPLDINFQYIITTLDASKRVLDSKDKYVRLTLDNSGDGGKLFGTTIYI